MPATPHQFVASRSQTTPRRSSIVKVGVVALAVSSAALVAFPRTTAATEATTEASTDAADAVIVVNPDDVVQPISRDLFGFNSEYSLFVDDFDPETGEVFPKLVDEVTAAGASVLRYPGGRIANSFRWKKAIGPIDQRGCQLMGAGREPAERPFGVDEHAQFAEQVGGSTNIVVNFDTATPEEAADWVEYMNAPIGTNPGGGIAWAETRAANGHPEPYGVKWWEVGNEVGLGQTWLGALSPQERAEAYAYGGSASYTGATVGTECEQTDEASRSSGEPNQEFVVYRAPITPDSQTIYVDGVAWEHVADLSAVGSEAHAYELMPDEGRIRFGDGVHGAIPAEDSAITIDYVSGPHDGYVDFYQAMKEVDPDINVCWVDHGPVDYTVLGDEPVDCLANHPYTFQRPDPDMNVVDTYDWVMQRADQRGQEIAALQQELGDAHPGSNVMLSEYAMYFGSDRGPTDPSFFRSLVQGIYMGSALIEWIDAGVPLAQLHPLTSLDPDNPPPGQTLIGNAAPFGYFPAYVPQAGAHVNNLFSHMLGTEQVASSVLNNPVRENTAAQSSYEALQVVASTNEDGELSLIVVNRDPDQDIEAAVLPEGYAYQAAAELWQVNGTAIDAHNTVEEPGAVALTKQISRVNRHDLQYTFPAHSVTAIKLAPVPAPTPDTELALANSEITGSRGESAATALTISSGDSDATGTVEVLAPGGWSASVSPTQYDLDEGETVDGELVIDIPDDARAGSHTVVVFVRERSQVADIAYLNIEVSEIPGQWDPIFFDTFDDAPVGEPPPGYTVTGNPDRVVVQEAEDGDGNVLTVRRESGDATTTRLTRTLNEAGDLRMSYEFRKVSGVRTAPGLVVELVDDADNLVLQIHACNSGVLRYTLEEPGNQGRFPIDCSEWHTIDVILHADTGDYELYVDGRHAADSVRRPNTSPPAAINIRPSSNTPPAEYIVDDVAVMAPE